MKTLDEVKDQIEPVLKQQKGQQAAQKQADALLARLVPRPGRPPPPRKISGDVDRFCCAEGFAARTRAIASVHGRNLRATEKSPPDMAPTSQGFAVYQLLAVKPPATPSFEEIRSKVEEEFKNERASILLTQKTQELSDRAKAEHDLKRAAKELGATVKTSDFVLPDAQVPEIGSLAGPASVVFTMKPAEIQWAD